MSSTFLILKYLRRKKPKTLGLSTTTTFITKASSHIPGGPAAYGDAQRNHNHRRQKQNKTVGTKARNHQAQPKRHSIFTPAVISAHASEFAFHTASPSCHFSLVITSIYQRPENGSNQAGTFFISITRAAPSCRVMAACSSFTTLLTPTGSQTCSVPFCKG